MIQATLAVRERAAQTAREWLAADPLFLDTETTGLNGQVVELAVLDREGAVRLETLVQPTIPVEEEAAALHGITTEMLRDAPRFDEVWPRLRELIRGRTVVVYNADFDRWRLIDSARPARNGTFADVLEFAGPRGFPPGGNPATASNLPTWRCAMLLYAEFWGERSDYYGDYRWQKLESAAHQCGIAIPPGLHRARTDAELCRQVVLAIAQNRGNDD
jgi:DNA polymerase-3 subunit epsilon